MIFATALDPLQNVALVASVAAVIVPAAWWVVRRIRISIESQLKEQTQAREVADKIVDLEGTLGSLDNALRGHMASEDRTNAKIEDLGLELISKLGDLESGIKNNQVHMMKALMAADEIPTQLWEVSEDDYHLVWANKAYLDLSGLSLAEARTDAVWLTVDALEREVVRKGSEEVGQSREDYSAEFNMVDPKTQGPIGLMHVEGHFIHGTGEHYFYLTTLIRV